MGWDSGRNLPVQNFVEYSPPRIMHSLEHSGHGKMLVYSLC